jgi:hypothetical protein
VIRSKNQNLVQYGQEGDGDLVLSWAAQVKVSVGSVDMCGEQSGIIARQEWDLPGEPSATHNTFGEVLPCAGSPMLYHFGLFAPSCRQAGLISANGEDLHETYLSKTGCLSSQW